ncbi:arabinose transporter [Thioclava sp. GXIMD4216]|uniref:arabinose transporter n=1 Tax=Thioclava sp. GXIMD4216 TaxID=3131929 RepID=UPI0030D24B76
MSDRLSETIADPPPGPPAHNGASEAKPVVSEAQGLRLLLALSVILFFAYICVAMALPVVSVHVVKGLGLSNGWGGLAAGMAFVSTIFSRAWAGGVSDRLGPKPAMARGLWFYLMGAVICILAGVLGAQPWLALAVLLLGRAIVGVGESYVSVSMVTWGIGLAGQHRAGRVMAFMGAAMYGALGAGAPLGLLLYHIGGFSAVMSFSALLPLIGLLAIIKMPGVAPHAATMRRSFLSMIGTIWKHGFVILAQGIGFAAIGAFFSLYFLAQGWQGAGLGLTAFGAGFVLVRVLFGHLPDRIGGLPVAMVSLGVEVIGQLLIWGGDMSGLALLGAFMTGLGCSMIYPSMGREVVALVSPQQRGMALGGFAAFQDLAYGLTGPVAGMLADRAGYGPIFLIGAIAAASGLGMVLWLRRGARIAVHGT